MAELGASFLCLFRGNVRTIHTKRKKNNTVCLTFSLLDSFMNYIVNIMTQLVQFFNCLSPECGRLCKSKNREKAASNYQNQTRYPTSRRARKHKLSNIYLSISIYSVKEKGYRLRTICFFYYVPSEVTMTTSFNQHFSNSKESMWIPCGLSVAFFVSAPPLLPSQHCIDVGCVVQIELKNFVIQKIKHGGLFILLPSSWLLCDTQVYSSLPVL